jgi:hypothetical protein
VSPRPSADKPRDVPGHRAAQERGLIELYVDEQARESYRFTEDGVRVRNVLAMVEGEDAEKVMEGLVADV